MQAIYGPDRIGRSDLAAQDIDHVLLISSWFQHHPDEQLLCKPPDEVLAELAGVDEADAATSVR